MDLELDDDQRALVDSVRTVLASEWPSSALRRQVERGEGADALWETMTGLDWAGVRVPEDCGGMGYGPIESALVHEQCGAFVAAGPLLATSLFAAAIVTLGDHEQRPDLLTPVLEGRSTGTVALTELVAAVARDDATRCAVTAEDVGNGWHLRGRARSVIDGVTADQVVVPVRLDDGGCAAFVVPTSAADVAPVETADASRRLAHLGFDTVVDPAARLSTVGLDAFTRVVDEAIVVFAAELVGTCRTILDAVLDHVREREQFGVKIGSFQALKHRLADGYLDLEAAGASVRHASVALAEDSPGASLAASSAKALASDVANRLGHEGIQMLGGLGFTWEHDMHLFVKRAMSSAAMLGTAEDHRQRTGRLLGLVPA